MRKRNFAITFEKKELDRLILDVSSCVSVKQCTHHLALHPYHLNNTSESLQNILSKGIAKYDKNLGGILLGYRNIKLLSPAGAISNDTCFIHVDISADFYLFKPEVGKTLTGRVNKISEDHVGCLVHEAFNVSLPKPADNDEWMGSMVQIGQEILFRISFIDLEGRLPYIRATLVSILSELDSGISTGEDTEHKLNKSKKKSKKIIFGSNSETEEIEILDKRQKKKKKKRKSDEASTSLGSSYEATKLQCGSDEFIEPAAKITKRKRKHTSSVETSYEENLDTANVKPLEYDESVKKKKKRKKSKHEVQDLEQTQYSECTVTKVKHKHKKKHC